MNEGEKSNRRLGSVNGPRPFRIIGRSKQEKKFWKKTHTHLVKSKSSPLQRAVRSLRPLRAGNK